MADFISLALVSLLVEWMKKPDGRTPEDVVKQIDLACHGVVQNALVRSLVQMNPFCPTCNKRAFFE